MDKLNFLVALVALLASGLAIVTVWRKSGAIEGKILERQENQQEWLRGHEKRIHTIEQADFLTKEEHDRESSKCVTSIVRQIDDNHANLEKLSKTFQDMEMARHHAREADNQRWSRIEITLGKLEEFVDAMKRLGRPV
mgnify:CR=1 FL=1